MRVPPGLILLLVALAAGLVLGRVSTLYLPLGFLLWK